MHDKSRQEAVINVSVRARKMQAGTRSPNPICLPGTGTKNAGPRLHYFHRKVHGQIHAY
jgi:hypothetical protein